MTNAPMDTLLRELKSMPYLHRLAQEASKHIERDQEREEDRLDRIRGMKHDLEYFKARSDQLDELLDCLSDVRVGIRSMDELLDLAVNAAPDRLRMALRA